MRSFSLIIFSFLFIASVKGQEFTRELPDKEYNSKITAEKFPNMDAVILIKEQSFQIRTQDISYGVDDYYGLSTTISKIMMVKMLTENAVKRYGTFEFAYREKFGDEITNGFDAKVRVLKENGDILVLPKKEIKTIVSKEDSDGDPLERKVIFKVPNLQVGDVLQYEYQFNDVFSYSTSGLFYYSDKDYVMFSNLYITLPGKVDIRTVSLPEEKVGQPKIQQLSNEYGSGETYFWSVKNLMPVVEEPYSRPFEDRAVMTGFYVIGKTINPVDRWNEIAKNMNEDYFDEGDIDDSEIELLGFKEKETDINLGKTDSLYTSLRKYFNLEESNSIYPVTAKIPKTFKKKKADASDLAYFMHLILKSWGQKSYLALVRDRREGLYEQSIPSLRWFDRLGLLVTINGKDRFYDFDRSLPTVYEFPWYLNPSSIAVLNGENCTHMPLNEFTSAERNIIAESHYMNISNDFDLRDSVCFSFKGFKAQKQRNRFYASEQSEIKNYFKDLVEGKCLDKSDSVTINNFIDEKEFRAALCGQSVVKPEVIDSFLTIPVKNVVLKNFRDEIFSVIRRSDFYFEAPFQFKLLWELRLPANYKLQSGNLKQKVTGPGNCYTEVMYENNGGTLKVIANIRIMEMFIQPSQFKQLVEFIEKSMEQAEKNIILVKDSSQV